MWPVGTPEVAFGWMDLPAELREPGHCQDLVEWFSRQPLHWSVIKSLMARASEELGCRWKHSDYVRAGADAP